MTAIPPDGFESPEERERILKKLQERITSALNITPSLQNPDTGFRFPRFPILLRGVEPLQNDPQDIMRLMSILAPESYPVISIPSRPPDKHLTNFAQDRKGLFKACICMYEKQYTDHHKLFIRHDAYTQSGQRLHGYEALHVELVKGRECDLSDFWRIYDVLSKYPTRLTDPVILEATASYIKWKIKFKEES